MTFIKPNSKTGDGMSGVSSGTEIRPYRCDERWAAVAGSGEGDGRAGTEAPTGLIKDGRQWKE